MNHYSPDRSLLEGDSKASDVLFKVLEGILEEFDLTVEDLASATTDVASDLEPMLVNRLVAMGCGWARCISQLASEACVQAFGTGVDASKSKNPKAREAIHLVVEVVGRLNKSPETSPIFERLKVRRK